MPSTVCILGLLGPGGLSQTYRISYECHTSSITWEMLFLRSLVCVIEVVSSSMDS